MSVISILKLINVFLLATVKYFITFPYGLLIGLNYTQTITAVTIGGITGFIFFYYFSGVIIRFYDKNHASIFCSIKKWVKLDLCHLIKKEEGKKKATFSKKNRTIAKLKQSYGLWGIIITTPVLLSIPLGAFLLNKYYPKRKNVLAYMMLSIVGWALVFSTFAIIFPKPM